MLGKLRSLGRRRGVRAACTLAGIVRVDYYLPPGPLTAVAPSARRAEAVGYDGFFTAETSHDPFLPLSIAAATVPGLELGTGIAVAFARSPMVVAHTAWDLATASEGRFMLGLGTQVRAHVTRRFSMPWEAPGPRLRDYVLSLRAIWSAWQNGSELRYDGEYYRFSLMTPFFAPGPIDHPEIPVFIAGVGPYMSRLAGEICHGFHVHPFHTVRYLDEVTLPGIAAGAAAAGRNVDEVAVSAAVFVATGHTKPHIAAARQSVRAQIAFYASTPTYRAVLDLHGWEIGPRLSALARRGEWETMADMVDDSMVDEVAVTGPPEEIGEKLRARYGSRLQRVAFYAAGPGLTPGLDETDWATIIQSLRT